MPKVAMLLSNPFVNDPRVYKEAKALANNGYEVTVLAWDRECAHPQREQREGFSVDRIRAKAIYGRGLFQVPALLLFCGKVLPRLRRGKFDVIHCHDLETLPLGLLAGRLTAARVVFDAHEPNYYADTPLLRGVTTWIARVMERFLANLASVVLTTNEYQIDKYRRMKVKNVRLVANYPEVSLIPQKPLERKRDHVILGRIGSIHEDSGVEQLVDAFVLLRQNYHNIDLKLVGGALSRDTGAMFQKIAALGDSIEFIPGYHYSELEKLYASLDIWIMPANPDSFYNYVTPTKFFEALCYGVPVITSDMRQVGRIVREENCGIVLDAVDPGSIAAAARRLIDNPALRIEMGENGQRAIREKYNWDVSARELLTTYQHLVGGE